jgi:hypothetical protein
VHDHLVDVVVVTHMIPRISQHSTGNGQWFCQDKPYASYSNLPLPQCRTQANECTRQEQSSVDQLAVVCALPAMNWSTPPRLQWSSVRAGRKPKGGPGGRHEQAGAWPGPDQQPRMHACAHAVGDAGCCMPLPALVSARRQDGGHYAAGRPA